MTSSGCYNMEHYEFRFSKSSQKSSSFTLAFPLQNFRRLEHLVPQISSCFNLRLTVQRIKTEKKNLKRHFGPSASLTLLWFHYILYFQVMYKNLCNFPGDCDFYKFWLPERKVVCKSNRPLSLYSVSKSFLVQHWKFQCWMKWQWWNAFCIL